MVLCYLTKVENRQDDGSGQTYSKTQIKYIKLKGVRKKSFHALISTLNCDHCFFLSLFFMVIFFNLILIWYMYRIKYKVKRCGKKISTQLLALWTATIVFFHLFSSSVIFFNLILIWCVYKNLELTIYFNLSFI
jgi:hypothetical protein